MSAGKQEQAPVQTFHKGWKSVYPVYINAKKTIAEGRRVPKSCAADLPSLSEILEVAKYFGVKAIPQPEKAYARDYTQRGRVKVELFSAEGKQLHPDFKNKMAFLKKLGQTIPNLASRQKGGGGGNTESSGGGGGGSGKKGKKNK